MSKKPKKEDYKPSAAEKASAAVAKAEYDYFKQNYEPLLIDMRDFAEKQDFRSNVRGRAATDVSQALSDAYTGAASAWSATDVDRYEDMSKAYLGQLQKADEAALNVKNTLSSGVLGTARKQAAEAQTGMAQASRLATSEALNRAKTNQQVAQSKFNAGVSLAGATIIGAADMYARKKGGPLGISNNRYERTLGFSPNPDEYQMSYVPSKNNPLGRPLSATKPFMYGGG